MRASFSLSYEDLESGTAVMFRLLGLIAGPDFGVEVAAALADTAVEESETLLEALVDAHLIESEPSPGRYRFHDLLRLYARERVREEETEHERKEALRRMLEWYLDRADAATQRLMPGRRGLMPDRSNVQSDPIFATHAEALAWFESEWVNLVAATRQAADDGSYPIAPG